MRRHALLGHLTGSEAGIQSSVTRQPIQRSSRTLWWSRPLTEMGEVLVVGDDDDDEEGYQ